MLPKSSCKKVTNGNLQARIQQLMDERTDCAVAHVYIRAGHDVNESTAKVNASKRLTNANLLAATEAYNTLRKPEI